MLAGCRRPPSNGDRRRAGKVHRQAGEVAHAVNGSQVGAGWSQESRLAPDSSTKPSPSTTALGYGLTGLHAAFAVVVL